jgi:hypothetical protein
MNRDIKKIVKWARSQGWAVEDDASGHTRFYAPNGDYVVGYPATPSRPARRMAELAVELRKRGLAVPPSKKEQRAWRAKEDESDE